MGQCCSNSSQSAQVSIPQNTQSSATKQSKKNTKGKNYNNEEKEEAFDETIWERLESSPQIGKWLKEVPIFRRVPDEKRNKLGGVMTEMKFIDGDYVFEQGDDGDRFYIIKSGTAVVSIQLPNSDEKQEVAELKTGDYFGETALLSAKGAKRNATIAAAKGINSELITLTLDSKTFRKLFSGLNVQLAKRKGVTEKMGKISSGSQSQHTEELSDFDENDLDISKSETEITSIVKIFQSCVLFKKLTNDQMNEIAQNMWHKHYDAGQKIEKKGQIGRRLYLIKNGQSQQYSDPNDSNNNNNGPQQEIKILSKGDMIGEIGLMYNSAYQYTYRTLTDCDFWIINRSQFRRILKSSSQHKLAEYEQFLKTVPIFDILLDQERKRIAEALEEIHFEAGHPIVKQGDSGDTFYIIKKGTAVVHKLEDGADKMREVMRLKDGDFFGERALIKNDLRAATVSVTDDCTTMECLMLDREGFTLLLGPLGDIMQRKIDTVYDVVVKDNNNDIKKKNTNGTSSSELSTNDNLQITIGTNSNEFELTNLSLSDLEIIGTLGKGSFGHVELVRLKNKDQISHQIEIEYFALKTVHKCHVVQMGQQEHIINEKNVLSTLNSLFIIRLYSTFKDLTSIYFLLEPVLGGELFALLRDSSAFDEGTAQFYAACVVNAFSSMHSKNIIYRDLKPENLLLASNGYLKITDFGFAKFVTDRTWTLCGTPDYLAPEVVSGIGHNKAVDWWTLGILIYEMISSFPPFYDEDPMQTYAKIMHGISNIHFPRHFSKNATDICSSLLHSKATKRLGGTRGGAQSIRDHPWFKKANFDWSALNKQTLNAPYIPNIDSPEDLSNFEEYSESDESPVYCDDGTGWDIEF